MISRISPRLWVVLVVIALTMAATAASGFTISATVQNAWSETWTDWHVITTNAWIRVDGTADVYNVDSPSPHWVLDFSDFLNPSNPAQASGMVAHIETGSGTEIAPDESIFVRFSYDVINPGDFVVIEQEASTTWPVTPAAVPEPASVLLALSAAPLAAFLRRR